MVYQMLCIQTALSRTDSCDGLEALTSQEWMTSSEWHQADTKSRVGVRTSAGMKRTGENRRHRWTWVHRLHSSRLLIFSASAAFGSSPHLLLISCIRLVSSSSPHRLHSAGLLIFSASAPGGWGLGNWLRLQQHQLALLPA
jgi:hypothetical protein